MFTKVSAQNFMCFQDFEVNLKDRGLIQIVGESEDRFFTSNGVGKTSLTEAILFCLFGSTTKGVSGDSVVNKLIDKDCIVSVEFDDGLIVERYRKHSKFGNSLILRKGDKEFQKKTIKETEQVLFERLNLSQEVFQILSYVSQENANFFIDSTDANQKTLLDKILDLQKFENAHDRVSIDIDNADRLIKDFEDNIEKYNIKLNALIENLEVLERNKEEQEEAQEKKKWQLKGEKDKLEEELKLLYSDLEKLQFELVNLDYDSDFNSKIIEKKKEVDAIRAELLKFEKEGFKLEAENKDYLKKLDVIEKGECPTCGSEFKGDNKEKIISEMHKTLESLNDRIIENDSVKLEIKDRLNNVNGEIKKLEDESREAFKKQEKLNTDIKLVNRDIDNLNRRLKEVSSNIEEKDASIENLEKDIEKLQLNIIELDDKIKDEEGNKTKYVEEKKLLTFWEKSFGKKGIRSFILDNVIDTFNEQINYYLSEIGYNNIQVSFSNKSKLKSGEERERISFAITIDSIEYDYHSLSGGEKTRLNLSVLFALRDLVTNNKSNILILDETFSFLDQSGCESVISLLKSKLSEEGGLNSIFLVNHNTLLDPLVPDKLVVRREGSFSKILN